MKKYIYILPVIFAATFGFLSVSKADFEISDGSVRALYHFNLPNQTSDTIGISDLTGGTFHGNAGTMLSNLHESAYTFGVTAPDSSPSSNYTQTTTSTGLSFGGWFNGTSSGAFSGVLLESHQQDFSVQIQSSSSVQCQMTDNVGNQSHTYSFTPAMATSSPNLIVCVYHGGFMNLYINGSLVGGPTAWPGSTPSSLHSNDYIAALGDYGSVLKGIGDELFLVNKDLIAGDISSLWNSGSGNQICTTIGCGTIIQNCNVPGTPEIYLPKSSSTITDNFDNFVVSSTLPENGNACAYDVKTYWWRNNNPSKVFTGDYYTHVFPDTPNAYLHVPKRENLWLEYGGSATDFTVNALIFANGDPNPVATPSADYHFTLVASSTSNVPSNYDKNAPCGRQCYQYDTSSSTVFLTPLPSSSIFTASSTPFCSATSSDWATQAFSWLFCIQPFATDAMNGTAQGFKLLPIINNITAFNDVVQGEVSPTGELLIAPSGTLSMMQRYDHLDFCPYVPDGTNASSAPVCFRALSSSSWTAYMDKNTHDTLFQFEDSVFVLAPLALALGLWLNMRERDRRAALMRRSPAVRRHVVNHRYYKKRGII